MKFRCSQCKKREDCEYKKSYQNMVKQIILMQDPFSPFYFESYCDSFEGKEIKFTERTKPTQIDYAIFESEADKMWDEIKRESTKGTDK